tara:strand:- start:156 stop:986 length:831 start_codon:yes stop_codon:yes gene_type:complete
MIIWLASYPKSGNTWVRLFLNCLLFSEKKLADINDIKIEQFPNRKHFKNITNNVDNFNEFVKNCTNAQYLLNLNKNIKFFKTHNTFWTSGKNSFSNEENTLGTIYIVRDPRNVITSIKNHYNKQNYEEALKFIKNEKKILISENSKKKEYDLPTPISSWGNHYRSWKKMKKNYLLIKYESLLNSPNSEFNKIVNYIEKHTTFKFNDKEVNMAIDSCGFKNFKKQESINGFIESPKNTKNKFFYLGPDNNWENLLNSKVKQEIEMNFENEMKELNYL